MDGTSCPLRASLTPLSTQSLQGTPSSGQVKGDEFCGKSEAGLPWRFLFRYDAFFVAGRWSCRRSNLWTLHGGGPMSIGESLPYRSPISKLLRFFCSSRDKWKARCKEAKAGEQESEIPAGRDDGEPESLESRSTQPSQEHAGRNGAGRGAAVKKPSRTPSCGRRGRPARPVVARAC